MRQLRVRLQQPPLPSPGRRPVEEVGGAGGGSGGVADVGGPVNDGVAVVEGVVVVDEVAREGFDVVLLGGGGDGAFEEAVGGDYAVDGGGIVVWK